MADKNVLVRVPKVGDILCVDANNKKQFIALDTYDGGTLPAGYTVVGVVASRQGNQALVVHKANAAKKWSDVMIWTLSGAALTDGASHTQNFTANGVTVPITWQTSTLSAFAVAVQSYLNGQNFGGHSYRCIYDAQKDAVLLIHDTFSEWKEPTFSGVTVTRAIGEDVPQNSTAYRKSGRSIYWGAINVRRYFEWAKTSGTVPTADVPVHISAGTDAVKLVEFQQNAFCADIRNAYCADPSNPTEDDYFRYVEAEYACEYPSNRASMAEIYRDGKDFTYRLVGKKYLAADGSQKELYPGAEYCAAVEYDADGLRKGSWFLPSKYQMGGVWSKLTYGHAGVSRASADPINRSLNAIGGSAISCASIAWCSAMLSSYGAWYCGRSGYFSINYFCYSFMCVPCVLLDLSEGED